MTKADRIRQTAAKHPNWSTKQIGAACDCSDSYVRTALRQRVGGKSSDHDRAYDQSSLGKTTRRRSWRAREARFVEQYGVTSSGLRYRTDADCRERSKAAALAWDRANPERKRQRQRDYMRRKAEATQ